MGCGCDTQSFNPNSVEEMIYNHPCYSKDAHHSYARIHLPVAPACNIQCNYCNRKYDCSNESRPGVTSQKLNPINGLKKVLFVGSKIRNLSVVGIAGPGDALANPKATFETFELIKKYAPDLRLCVSTNGLALPFYVDELVNAGVDHITVTINTTDPEIGAKIYPWVYDTISKKRYTGVEGAKLLLERQLEGIKLAVSKGVLIKANSVLIPNINDKELVNVSKKLKELGVFLHNIMPLLSEPEFGTKFGLDGVPSATEEELQIAQEMCGMNMDLMTHCKQCRADAIGLLGEDKSSDFELESFANAEIEELVSEYNLKDRVDRKEKIEEFKRANKKIRVAISSSDKITVNEHFGSSKSFLIYELDKFGATIIEERTVTPYCLGAENCGSNNPIDSIKIALRDVKMLVTVKIGECPMSELSKLGLSFEEGFAYQNIDDVLVALNSHFFGLRDVAN